MKNKLLWIKNYLKGRYRLLSGFCPMCNSDAPEIYDCPLCNSYSSARGDEFPPDKKTKSEWWVEYKSVIDCQFKVREIIRMHKQ